MGEERLVLGPPSRRLEARLALPAGARAGAVVCHPHPLYGGDMRNAVVAAVARAFATAGVAALRFDFGPFTGGDAEVADAGVALEALAVRLPAGSRLVLAGYSFGAWIAVRAAAAGAPVAAVIAVAPPLAFGDWTMLARLQVPLTVVAGDRDEFCAPGALARLPGRTHVIVGADHFLVERETEVARRVVGAAFPPRD